VCDDFDVIRLRSILDDIGISIPDDVSIVGFDDYDFSRFLSPPLTTVNQPVTEMGVSCGKLILELINKRNLDDIHDVIHKTQLVIRKSVKVLE
jgi:GntR family transcriptional regulator of arabinose operon